ncbi:hypothetical protein RT717_01020 [Imperialibacter roseus]|uniref:Lipoprotein n=1 Tax=Imperialibacter roseus TaxID=1324217 RepID=A0ABZ0IR46_9BACT|nr:hypothetical protein [Imperialibacter roseus]WOK07201.1 hypothetical protein RT717_01020 [Imperialibacter roseus]
MKNISISLFALTLVACGQSDDAISPNSSGEVEYYLNGVNQKTANVYFELNSSPDSKFCDFDSYLFRIDNYERKVNDNIPTYESFYFDKLTLDPGKRVLGIVGCNKSLNPGVSFFSKFSDDLLAATYDISQEELENNWIAIDEIDEDTKTVSGRFSLSFIMNWGHEENAIPDTIRITNGSFNLTLD